jgi:hypothetical protein
MLTMSKLVLNTKKIGSDPKQISNCELKLLDMHK